MSAITEPTRKPQKILNMGTENAAAVADRISDLTDDLLCHILSFLPTKQSVATSILSKRWRPLWTLVPILDFDYDLHSPPDKDASFVRFVNTVFKLRGTAEEGGVPIKKFCLKCCGDDDDLNCDQFTINTWVTAACRHNVEDLRLFLPDSLKSPHCVLSCRTLVVLETNVLWRSDISPVHLPALKILHLTPYASSSVFDCLHITNLLSGCPVLEELLLHGLLVGLRSMSECQQFPVSLSKLTTAKLYFEYYHSETQDWIFYLLKKLPIVKDLFFSQSLAYASVNEFPIFQRLTCLEFVVLFGTFPWAFMTSLLQNCHQLKVVVIYQLGPQYGFVRTITHPHPVPVSPRLREVQFRNCYADECELEVLRYFLKNAKNLETLKICSPTLPVERRLRFLNELSADSSAFPRCQLLFGCSEECRLVYDENHS